MNSVLLEVCVGNQLSAEAAVAGGAKRIELCSALPLGGLTPSAGLQKTIRQRYPNLTIHVLIRPREGNFVYSPTEVNEMVADIETAISLGADGIVSGALTPDGRIDLEATSRLIEASKGRPFTFHRAFDHAAMPLQALSQLITLRCTRILTSGQANTAEEGIVMLKKLVETAQNRIIIIPAAGITPQNAKHIALATGATEIHASCTAKTTDKSLRSDHPATQNNTGKTKMGINDNGTTLMSSAESVRQIIEAFQA